MPPLRTPPTHSRRALVAALLVLAAACGTSAPEPGSPHTSTSSAITVYTLAESGAGQPGQISHGKPMDIDWDALSNSFLVSCGCPKSRVWLLTWCFAAVAGAA